MSSYQDGMWDYVRLHIFTEVVLRTPHVEEDRIDLDMQAFSLAERRTFFIMARIYTGLLSEII